MQKLICFMLCILPVFVLANDNDETLTLDNMVTNSTVFSFKNDKNIRAKTSDFHIVNYLLMSNEQGERWATITLTNMASGHRTLESDHLVALFANGERRFPQMVKLSFSGKETQTLAISFGNDKFPILSISTQEN